MAGTEVLLFLSSCATAIIHALIPDHWLPFALLARSQGWTGRRTVAMVGLTGLIHAAASIAVSALAILLGRTSAHGLAERAGESMEFLAGALLVLFGVAYGLWAHLREARAHSGRPPGSRGGEAADQAGEGGASPPHMHGHLLQGWFRGALSGGALVAVVGISPCALMVPILFAASARGFAALVASAVGFAACTIGTMVAVTLIATLGMRRLDLPFFTRYGDLMSGLLIAAIGAVVMVREA